mgnify:CR=1 FL=1
MSKQKSPESHNDFRDLNIQLIKLSLGELGSATGGLQTVLLLLANPKTLVYQGFSASLSEFNPYFNPLQTQSNLVRLVDRTLCLQQPKAVRVYYT